MQTINSRFCAQLKSLENSFESIRDELFEFSHLKPVNEFTGFGEFLLDTDRAIASCGQGFMYYPRKFTISGTPFFTLVVKITYVKLDNLTT